MCCIRLHNDDIHTYPEVTEALTQIDLSEPHVSASRPHASSPWLIGESLAKGHMCCV